MISLNNCVLVIIRSAGERTEILCSKLILAQGIPPQNIVTVREAPFSEAMRKSFEMGIERDLSWTFCVDADVLLRPGSIGKMIEFANQQPKNVCEIQGLVLCKYFGGPRPAGNHLYRTSLLKKVLQNIPVEGVSIRPEFHTLEKMKAQGFPWFSVPYLIGLHDFEQYHKDIFRKCFVQAHKHLHYSDLFMGIWRKSAEGDQDYRVALAGFSRGVEHSGPVFIDIRDRYFQHSLDSLGVVEKTPIELTGWSLESVESAILEWQEPEIYIEKFPSRFGLGGVKNFDNPLGDHRWLESLREKYHKIGVMRIVPYVAGRGLENLGRRLQALVMKG